MTTDTETLSAPRLVATRRHDKLGVTLSDGTWIEVDPIPPGYCPHGKYVGGCGIDWMCGPCEMGDGDPTAEYYQWQISSHTAGFIEQTNLGMLALKLNPKFAASFTATVAGKIRIHAQQIAYARRNLGECERLSAGPDDDQWWSRAQELVTNLAHAQGFFDADHEDRPYTEQDEIHEYGYVPEGGEI